MAEHFDLVAIGTGAAAATIAFACREAGWRVAIVDCRPFGGTCVNRGCDPKKVLVGAGEVVDWARRMQGHGVAAEHLRIDWPALMRFKHTFTDPVPASREKAFEAAGIAAYHETARFVSPHTLLAGDALLSADHFAIATGAAPARLNIPGEELLTTSDAFLDLETLPPRMAFVGGGYIAFEFAHLAARAGVRVTILHRGARPLEQFDGQLVERLLEHTRRLGIEVRLGEEVRAVERTAAGLRVRTSSGGCETDLAVHAAGRPPLLEPLDLPAAQVEFTRRGVKVDAFLQSPTNPRVYAAGDAADSGGPPLTPVAGYEGRVAAANLLGGNRVRTDYRGAASSVYTVPPLAMTGLTEDAARTQGLEFDVKQGDSTGWYTSRRIAEDVSGFKVLVERGSGRILGAHLLGEGGPEIINLFALAIRNGLTAAQIREPLYAYPTHGSNLQYMVE